MKLLILDQFSQPGGAQQCLLDLLPALPGAVVAMPGDGPMFSRVRALGCETARIDCGPYASGSKTPGDLARFLREAPRLARQIQDLARPADLVYINGPRLLPAAALARIRKPVVFHTHSYLPPGPTRKLSGLALQRLGAHVIASCRHVADPWKHYARQITVVYNGVAGPSTPRQPRTGPFTIGCIGRIAPEKGQREFVEVARLIHAKRPDAQFAIYGETMFAPPEYEQAVRAAAAGLPIDFKGWVADVYEALANIDVLIVPSAPHEATTRVILEAIAANVPVIAFPSGGIPEVLPAAALARSIEEMADLVEAWSERRAPAPPQEPYTLERYRAEILSALRSAARSPSNP